MKRSGHGASVLIESPSQGQSEPGAAHGPTWNRAGLAFNVAVTVLDVGVAIAAFAVARDAGAGEATAYLIAGVGPVLGGVAVWVRAGKLSGASLAVFAFTALSAAAALVGSRDADALLYKDAAVTGLIGLIFGGSLLCRRPLAFYFGQRYATDGTHEGMQEWTGMWQYPRFRRAQYVITVVWAVAYLLEAAVQTLVVHASTFDVAYAWTQVLPWIATALAVAATVVLARHYARP
ncbi:VC0807 family protein [uncultured Jatrophihabitans sp.]|uniref:VC0807 family protein n=1 Tax=uncultured Jatrophihabitans sp. TaxID=1610747 RepID=UPI0035C9605E